MVKTGKRVTNSGYGGIPTGSSNILYGNYGEDKL